MAAPLIGALPITTLNDPNPAWREALAGTGIVPEHIYVRCDALVRFEFDVKAPVRRTTTPKVGQKPIRKRKKATR